MSDLIERVELPPFDDLELLPVPAESADFQAAMAAVAADYVPATATGLRVSRRAEWGWAPGTEENSNVRPRGAKMHYPGGGAYRYGDHIQCLRTVAAWDRYHRSRGSRAIEYNGLLCWHGYFIEARSTWERMISRPGSNGSSALNYTHLGFQMMFGAGDPAPTDRDYAWAAEVVAQARRQGMGAEVLGHRDGYATACPGDPIYANRGLIRVKADTILAGGTPTGPVLPPPPPPPPPPTAPTSVFSGGKVWPDFTGWGQKDSDTVRNIQARLIATGDAAGLFSTPTGNFFAKTREAVMRFQTRNNPPADGLVGPNTAQLMFSYPGSPYSVQPDFGITVPTWNGGKVYSGWCYYGNTDSDSARNVQQRLITLGYAIPAGPTGNWYGQTAAALSAWQADVGLPATGKADAATLRGLFVQVRQHYTIVWGK